MSSDAFLEQAGAIGRRIVASAIWDDGRCSWIGASLEPAEPARPEYSEIGPMLYNGSAGVGLFLAQLAAATGDAGARRTAVGALRHAIERAVPAQEAQGLHWGPLGIAWAASRVAALANAEELAAGARRLARSAVLPGRCPDLLLGTGGACVALLALAARLDEPPLVVAASALGESLLAGATVSRRGWSWADPERPGPHHLCGVSHGAGGIGWALAELFATTGDARFRDAAAGAFAYERSWLDPDSGTWPDLRANGAVRSSMVATWCHGEAGIALSRLRALAVLRERSLSQDADISVATTRTRINSRLPFAIHDLSLCHGIGGAALALLTAGDHATASAVGHVAAERYGKRCDYPCGVYGTTPGLFRGLAGIGWLFLCLHDPRSPSPLSVPPGG